MILSENAGKNRKAWDEFSIEYNKMYDEEYRFNEEFVWGYWAIPEKEINAFGDISGKHVLELGCGQALQSIRITQMGAHAVALDNSDKQLTFARRNLKKYNVEFPLIHASAEELPFPDNKFDIVFCDHGAMSFSETKTTLSEVHRVLKKKGYFIFNIASPLQEICYDTTNDILDDKLHQNYFELGKIEDEGFVYYQHTYSDLIKLFKETGFRVVDLIELRPTKNIAKTSEIKQGLTKFKWATKWPAENLWKIEKESAS